MGEPELGIRPIYPQSDKHRLYSKDLRVWIASALRRAEDFVDPLPSEVLRPLRLRRSHRRVQRHPPSVVDGGGQRRPAAAGVRRAAAHPTRVGVAQAHVGAAVGGHRPSRGRRVGAALPRAAAVRAHERETPSDRRDRTRPGVDPPDASPAARRRWERKNRGGGQRVARRGRGRDAGGVDGADRGAGRAARDQRAGVARGLHDVGREQLVQRTSAPGRSADRTHNGRRTQADARPTRAGRDRHPHRHARADRGRHRLQVARRGRRRRATPVRRGATGRVAGEGRGRPRSRRARDDGHADPAHRGDDGLRRPRRVHARRDASGREPITTIWEKVQPGS